MTTEGILLFFIGLFASFLGTLVGGGGLITIPAMMLFGLPVQIGVATNKFSSGIASFSSVATLIRKKALTTLRYVWIAILGGLVGGLFSSHLKEETMNIVAIILLILVLLISMREWDWENQKQKSSAKKMDFIWTFLIAVYDGGFGPGSSTFGILHYIRLSGEYTKAVQFTRVLILGSCVGGFIVFYHSGYFQWKYAIPLASGSIIGTELALKILPSVPKVWARKLIHAIIFLLILQVSLKLL